MAYYNLNTPAVQPYGMEIFHCRSIILPQIAWEQQGFCAHTDSIFMKEAFLMNKRNFYVGMGLGLAVGGAAMFAMRPKKRTGLHPLR